MPKNIAIIGSGPTGLGFLRGLAEQASSNKLQPCNISEIHIFDTSETLGAGTAYDPSMADPEHILNGTLSHLPDKFQSWVNSQFKKDDGETIDNRIRIESDFREVFERRLQKKFLKRFNLEYDATKRTEYVGEFKDACEQSDAIWESFKTRHLSKLNEEDLQKSSEFYPRTLLGMFAIDQFEEAVKTLGNKGFMVIRHPKTEVTSLSKAENGKLILNFADEQLEADNVVITNGGWKNITTWQSNRYFNNIWPIYDLKNGVEETIAEELRKRSAKGDLNKEITIGIEGKGLSAIDVAKTLLQGGILETNEDGSVTFSPDTSDHTVKVLMISRTPLIHKVIARDGWGKSDIFKQSDGKFKHPDGLLIEAETYPNIASGQDGKVRLWQAATILTRAIETAYKAAEIHAHKSGDVVGENNARSRAETAREFLYDVLSNVKKDEAGITALTNKQEFKEFIDGLSGNPQSQLKDIEQHFHLQLDGASYAPILTRFNEVAGFAPDNDPWQQMRKDLHEAEHGDAGGFVVWREFISRASFMPFLPKEESIYCGNFFYRYLEVFNGMPPISAKELLAFHEAGSLDLVTMGKETKRSYLTADGEKIASVDRVKSIEDDKGISSLIQDHKVVFENEKGETVVCDIAINAAHRSGVGFKPTPLFKSLQEQGIIKNFMPPKDGVPLDENGNPTMENLLILFGGAVKGAEELGRKIAISNFGTIDNPQPNTAVTSVASLQEKEAVNQRD